MILGIVPISMCVDIFEYYYTVINVDRNCYKIAL